MRLRAGPAGCPPEHLPGRCGKQAEFTECVFAFPRKINARLGEIERENG